MVYALAIPPWIKMQPIRRDIWRRLYYSNQNFMAVFSGGTGSGKSFSALRLAHEIDRATDWSPRFDLSKCVFLPSDFLDLVRRKLPRGSFIVWDEMGVEANARKWYSLKNMLISYVTQTFRYKNYGVLYTVPSLSFVDKQIRLLFHAYIEMKGVNINKKRAHGFWKWFDFSPHSGKVYPKIPRYFLNGKKYIVGKISFELPPKEMVEEYELKKREMLEKWYSTYHKQLALIEETVLKKSKGDKEKPKRLYEELKSDSRLLKSVIDLKKGLVHAGKLMIKFDLNKDKAYALSKMLNDDIQAGVIKLVL